MRFYQVNQSDTFDFEFPGNYLCCPNAGYGGWPLMWEMCAGDILVHYKSAARSILGVSRVTTPGIHRGSTTDRWLVIPGTCCIQYCGVHLSDASFREARRVDLRANYSSYLEVHTTPIVRRSLRKYLERSPQKYLVELDPPGVMRFLEENAIAL